MRMYNIHTAALKCSGWWFCTASIHGDELKGIVKSEI